MEAIRYYVPMEDPKVIAKTHSAYPGSLRSVDLASKIYGTLVQHGFTTDSTMLATSLCCDEVNRELEQQLGKYFGDNFSMGGLAGFPFGGVTSFGAMAKHIPDEGNCLVVYATHVGIDSNGNVGRVNRRGMAESNTCCGSAVAAHGYVKKVMAGEEAEAPGPITSPLDAQQTWVGSMLLRHASRLEGAPDSNVELPLALFDSQDEFMKKVVKAGCGAVANPGKIALVGGIQINTPAGTPDYFLPKIFEIRNNKGELQDNLMDYLVE